MKKIYIFIGLLSGIYITQAQNVGIGTSRPLSKLHVAGDLRVDSLAIHNKSGLVMHNQSGVVSSLTFTGKKTDILRGDGSFGDMATGAFSPYWTLTGNVATDPRINFIGTTDNTSLKFRVNNIPSGEISSILENTSFGMSAFVHNTAGYLNTAIGSGALQFNTIGTSNTAIGRGASLRNAIGADNVAIGASALEGNIQGNSNTAVGADALRGSTNSNNTAVGAYAQAFIRGGKNNTSIGYYSLYDNMNGSYNCAIGTNAMVNNRYGSNNVAVGSYALNGNLDGKNNVAVGNSVLSKSTGSSNSGIGALSLLSNSEGVSNSAVGASSLINNTTGINNSAVGFKSLGQNITGSANTAVGMFADVAFGNLVNATAIGYNAKVNASNKVRIGNASITKIEGQVPFSTPSDGRFKFNVKEDVAGLEFIMRLRPVTYQFDVNQFDHLGRSDSISEDMKISYEKAVNIQRTGFIAQEVENAASNSGYNFSGVIKPQSSEDHYSLSYETFVVPLVKAVQEQEEEIRLLKQQLHLQDERINKLIEAVKNR